MIDATTVNAVARGPLAVLQARGFATASLPGEAEIELCGIMCDGAVAMGPLERDGTPAAANLDAQAGHPHDLVDGDGVVLLASRYHVHVAPEIGADPRGLTPEAQFYERCVVSEHRPGRSRPDRVRRLWGLEAPSRELPEARIVRADADGMRRREGQAGGCRRMI